MTLDSMPLMVQVHGKIWAVPQRFLETVLEPLHCRLPDEDVLGKLLAEEKEALVARRAAGPKVSPGGVAQVDLSGTITPKGSILDLLFGGSGGLATFMNDLRSAVDNPDVGSVVLNIDSPGGLVDLVPEAAAQMRQIRSRTDKPIVAVANTLAASAAYWLASQAHEVVVTPSGEVGSVGVYVLHRDMTGAMEQMGVKPTLIKAGVHKIEGNPYEKLSPDAQAKMQQDVNDYYGMFVKDVAVGRGVDAPDPTDGVAFGGGQTFLASRAVRNGLADRVGTLDQTISRLSSGRAKVRRTEADDHERFEVVIEESKDRRKASAYSRDDRIRLVETLAGLR